MVKIGSALDEHLSKGAHPQGETVGVSLTEVSDFRLTQIAAWPESLHLVEAEIARFADCDAAPGPGRATTGTSGTLLRVEPLKWWLINGSDADGDPAPKIASSEGAVLDLSSSRTWVRLTGPRATFLLNHFLPINLSDTAFPEGSVAATAFHHVGVTLWRDDRGHNLLLPRSFAASLWELLVESSAQYGYEIT